MLGHAVNILSPATGLAYPLLVLTQVPIVTEAAVSIYCCRGIACFSAEQTRVLKSAIGSAPMY